MILREIDPESGLPKVSETRLIAVPDPAKRQCTCEQNTCLWYPLPRRPIGDLVHQLESHDDQPWWPRHQTWQEGGPSSVLCWKCGRAIKGWRPKLTPFGDHVYVDGLPAVHLTLYDHYRAKRFQAYLPRLTETVQFDVLHCADCEIKAEDGQQIVAIYLSGLLEAYRYGEELGKKLKLASAHSPDTIATYLARWAGVEPLGPIHRTENGDEQRWRS